MQREAISHRSTTVSIQASVGLSNETIWLNKAEEELRRALLDGGDPLPATATRQDDALSGPPSRAAAV